VRLFNFTAKLKSKAEKIDSNKRVKIYKLNRSFAASKRDLPRAIKLPRVNVTPNFTGLKKTIIDCNNKHENIK
jgi:hypothetical protein